MMRRWEALEVGIGNAECGRKEAGPAAVGGNGIRISECGMRKIKAKSRAEVQDHRSAVFWRAGRIRAQGALTTYNSQPPTHNPINYPNALNHLNDLNELNDHNDLNEPNEHNDPNGLNHPNDHIRSKRSQYT